MSKEEIHVNEIYRHKAEAIKHFVSTMIGAFDAGFVDKNNPTLSEIHQVARNHIKDNYGIDTPDIIKEWSKEVAESCGLIVDDNK